MHVVHLTASSFFGGPERQMLGLAQALPPEFSTTFLSFSEGGRCQTFLAAARANGFDAAELKHDSPRFRTIVSELVAFLRGNFVDVLVTHGYKSNLLGRPAARSGGIPIVSVSRGWTGENLKVWCYEAADRFHLRFMDRVVCVSAGQARMVRRAGVPTERIRVIRNAARLDAFANPDPSALRRLREFAGGDGPIVFAAGRLSPEKGFHVLIDAAANLLKVAPTTRFVLFGEGSERDRLQQRANSLGIVDQFRMPGFRRDLDLMLPWADLVVLPSLTEGLPNIALEAMAAGVPVVATTVGGNPEIVVDGRTGFLVPPADPIALADRMSDLLAHTERARMFGRAGRLLAEEQFSFARQAQEYQALFAELQADSIPNRSATSCIS
ncbi:MAG TPA: glycosyltransferase family 4 protein [Gemmataceae bacterium]|jgi:glycosyltransferase involved in cell wall biosynthesis|nr:glycosyltransferase family 4 protein [Gemmataceae bacterium]